MYRQNEGSAKKLYKMEYDLNGKKNRTGPLRFVCQML